MDSDTDTELMETDQTASEKPSESHSTPHDSRMTHSTDTDNPLPTALELTASKSSEPLSTNPDSRTTSSNVSDTTKPKAITLFASKKPSDTNITYNCSLKTSDRTDTPSATPATNMDKDYDKDLIEQVFKCRQCDYVDSALSKVKDHVKVHQSKPVWWPKSSVASTSSAVSSPVSLGPKLAKKWLSEFNSDDSYPFKFVSDTRVRCHVCESNFDVKKKSQLKGHCDTQLHQNNILHKCDRNSVQVEGEIASSEFAEFSRSLRSDNGLAKDLCRMAVAANISWRTFDNEMVRSVLRKHIGKVTPCSRTIAGKLDEIYDEVMEDIKKNLQGEPFWLGTDETNGMG